jgi:hypothetical protein
VITFHWLNNHVTFDLDEFGQPLRIFPPHWMAAGVALLGAGALQIMWPAAISAGKWQWWALLVAATVYLLATAEFHRRHARWRPNGLVPRLWSLGRGLGLDLVVGFMAGILMANGHSTSVMQAGLWLLAPALIGASAASAAAEALALNDGARRFWNDTPLTGAPLPPEAGDRLRLASGGVLLLLFWAIG